MNTQTVAVQVLSGNPFTFNVFIKNFFDKWYDSIDKLYIQIDTTSESYSHRYPEIKKIFKDMCNNDPKIVLKEYPHTLSKFKYKNFDFTTDDPTKRIDYHGCILRSFLDECEEEIVIFTHDDCFILDDVVLKSAIADVKNNVVDFAYVSCGGTSPGEYVSKLYQEYFPNAYSQIYNIDTYNNMVGVSSAFFVGRKRDLINTNLWYDQKTFKKGEIADVFPNTILEHDIFLDVVIYPLYQLFHKNINRMKSINIEDNIILYDLRGFDSDYEFAKIKNKFQNESKMIHFTASSWVKNLMHSYATNKDISVRPTEDEVYGTTVYLERMIFNYLSILSLFDFNQYPEMLRFKNEYISAFESYIKDYNNYILTLKQEDERFLNLNLLMNRQSKPYQIDMHMIPYDRLSDLLSLKQVTKLEI